MLLRSCKIEVVSFSLDDSAKTRISNLLESRFSERAERIEAKSISLERYFTAQHSSVKYLFRVC